MITVQDVYDFIDSFAPFSSQMSFDNSGLLVGDPEKAVRKICVCLDITNETVADAAKCGADLMVSHHPVLFKPRRQILNGDPAYALLCGNISAICAHTNLDCAVGGVNDCLADIFSLSDVKAVPDDSSPAPLLRVGRLPESLSAMALAEKASTLLKAGVRWCDGGKTIETLAVCGGAGGDLVGDVASMGVDALLTGDADYHDFLDAEQMGVTLIAAGHFETETPVIPVLAKKLQDAFPTVEVEVLFQKTSVKHL